MFKFKSGLVLVGRKFLFDPEKGKVEILDTKDVRYNWIFERYSLDYLSNGEIVSGGEYGDIYITKNERTGFKKMIEPRGSKVLKVVNVNKDTFVALYKYHLFIWNY